FYNVLKGEMSIVGPRPERPFFVEKFKKQIPLYANRLKVKPGLTGYAQVKHKYDTSLEDVKEKLKYDLFYIENISMRLDLKIMFRTIFVVLFPGDKAH
ncbi:MAG: sugar transferase, partial [Candidatus Delongbacteria bacterium]|nr:sugar transferase [Candidatus Delongbacteria bacterium]